MSNWIATLKSQVDEELEREQQARLLYEIRHRQASEAVQKIYDSILCELQNVTLPTFNSTITDAGKLEVFKLGNIVFEDRFDLVLNNVGFAVTCHPDEHRIVAQLGAYYNGVWQADWGESELVITDKTEKPELIVAEMVSTLYRLVRASLLQPREPYFIVQDLRPTLSKRQ